MNEHTTWKPCIAAPVLKKISCLSEDARRVLGAVQMEQRKHLSYQKDVSNYYRNIYEKKFDGAVSIKDAPLEIKPEILSWDEGREGQPCGFSESLSEKHNFHTESAPSGVKKGILNNAKEYKQQFHGSCNGHQLFQTKRSEKHCISLYQGPHQPGMYRSLNTSQHMDCSTTLSSGCEGQKFDIIPKSSRPGDICQNQQDVYFHSNKENSLDLKANKFEMNHKGADNVDGRFKNKSQVSADDCTLSLNMQHEICEKRIERHKHPEFNEGSNVSNQFFNNAVLSTDDHGCKRDAEEVLLSQLLFSQDPDEIVSEVDFSTEISEKAGPDRESIPADVEMTPCGTTANRKSTFSSKIARRLYEQKKWRQENEEDGKEQNKGDRNPKITLPQYFVPYKKKKEEGKIQSKFKSLKTQAAYSTHNVTDMIESERRKVFDKFLQSKETAITLLYTDGATQLRESKADANSAKKKCSNMKMKAISQVSGVYLKSKLEHDVLYIPALQIMDASVQEQIDYFFKQLLNSGGRKVCFGAKDFLIVMVRCLEKTYDDNPQKDVLASTVWDPVVAEWLLNPDKSSSTFQQMLNNYGIQNKKMSIDNLGDNAFSEDLDLLLELMQRQFQTLCSKSLMQLFLNVEIKLTPILAVMDTRKVKVHTDTMLKFSEILQRKMESLEHKAHEIVGHSFTINSPAQIRQVLFEELKLHTKLLGNTKLAKTAVGHQLSTSESVLTQLIELHPLPAVILEYRQLQKLKSTYIDGMMSAVVDGYLSTHWDQTSAATGRLSSHSPNIQAIPKTSSLISVNSTTKQCVDGNETGEKSVEIFARDSFISHDGWSFLSADFQQIELRLLAHLANDSTLLRLFKDNDSKDIFVELTAQWLRKSQADVTSSEREQTKRIVYSVMYGAGKEKLAEYLKITPAEAKNIIDSFLVSFPAVNHFSRKCIEFCRQKGYTESIFKRRRIIPNITHPSPPLRAQAERKAVNFCVQGSAADLCKAAMLQVEHTLLQHSDLQVRLLVQIHDELLFEIPDEHILRAGALIKSVMEDSERLCDSFVQLRVPIKVTMCVGKTWGHMSPLPNTSS
ncbi:DNA polymerase nu-like [Saccostrea echinata]|uniref:DNA polymerase nu-like n=1 Tax=Saccostrea echinata TaxID=191078 RepID=UPI002A829F80|nr:DNA polymerase nu-like [Saccostrea echinata]